MRWDNLFDDLESQLEQELGADDLELQAEEYRLKLARLTLRERLIALSRPKSTSPSAGSAGLSVVHRPEPCVVELTSGESLRVVAQSFGRDWFAAERVERDGPGGGCLIALDAVNGIRMSAHRAHESLGNLQLASDEGSDGPERPATVGRLTDRIGFAFALRDLCRRRHFVHIHTTTGVYRGTIDRVGRDHLDLAIHEPGRPRRHNEVSECRVIPLSRISWVEL